MPNDKTLELVRNLIARAEHANTPAPEAELCLKQANKLMAKHAIDDAMLRASQSESQRRAPARVEIKLGKSDTAEFWPALKTILNEIAVANRCTGAFYHASAVIFGMDEDVRWVEMLYTSIYFDFLSHIAPRWDAALGYDANVYNFKVAGFSWKDINAKAVEAGEASAEKTETYEHYCGYHPETGKSIFQTRTRGTGKMSGSMISAYKRHAKKIGDANLVSTTSFSEYRRQFTDAFSTRISTRIRDMADDSAQEANSVPGAALALTSSMEDVNRVFWEEFPQFAPLTPEELEKRRLAAEEYQRKTAEARERMLNEMTPKRRAEFLEKEEREKRRESARNRKYWAEQDAKHNASAHARGRSAANASDLSKKRYADAADERKSLA